MTNLTMPKPTRRCQANNKLTCRYHAPYEELKQAIEKSDFAGVEAARQKIRDNELQGISEKKPQGKISKREVDALINRVSEVTKNDSMHERHRRKDIREGLFDENSSELMGMFASHIDKLRARLAETTDPVERVKLDLERHSTLSHMSAIIRNAECKKGGMVVDVDETADRLNRSKAEAEKKYKANRFLGKSKDLYSELQAAAQVRSCNSLMRLLEHSYDDENWGTYRAKV